MNKSKNRILIVDDSPGDIQVLVENLKHDFLLSIATSGQKALDLIDQHELPDVILLDVSMPIMDGYETCRALKSHMDTKSVDVIFVSAYDSTEEKLKGYDAGGSDYLIKPVQPEELLKKVYIAITNMQLRRDAEEQQQSVMDAAMSAIKDAGEQATVVNFLRQTFSIEQQEQLAQLVVETGQHYDLTSSVQICTELDQCYASTNDPMPPLEKELLYRLKDTTRIHQSGRRLILNFGPISQIVKNMPEDEDACGRLRDHLAIILEGAKNQSQRLLLKQQLTNLWAESQLSLRSINQIQARQKQNNMHIVDGLLADVQRSFLSYGLSEHQEELLLTVIKKAVNETLENFEEGLIVDEEMESIIQKIGRFVEQFTAESSSSTTVDDSLEFF